MNHLTLGDLISLHVHQHSNDPAILGIEGKSITYQQLFEQIDDTVKFLNGLGIGNNDPVAIVLPNGPMMATAFLSVTSGASSAPLNPAYTAREFEYFIKDLAAKAVIVQENSDSPVVEVAQNLSIPIITLIPKANAPEGLFTCTSDAQPGTVLNPGKAKRSDIALILHTSGTTNRPKMVPLTQKNLCTSAENIRQTLKLTPKDRCLNIMPLFHIHGLMAAILASMAAGASVVCTPGFYAPKFFGWLDEFNPSWYTAVPTMHQAILNRSQNHLDSIKKSSLRFIRSSSSSLAPNVMGAIEETFGVPIIEAYGMTEASHQMACNPLPPGTRKPGSVGLPAGPEIAIMAEDQPEFLPENTLGEIVIRGDNVTLGYINNSEANLRSFTKGWFRTGDQGYLDQEGYLFITGRLKEIINRGGEKISPREVDEILLKHPKVLQAVTFSMPDEDLGENVAAAVITTDNSVNEQDLKRYAAKYLAPHKVPTTIVILDEIPKGPTGKLQRIGLAKKLGLGDSTERTVKSTTVYVAPRTTEEKTICEIWEKILDRQGIGIHDNFRALGGDSMLATLIHSELETVFGRSIPLVDLYQASSVAKQALLIMGNA